MNCKKVGFSICACVGGVVGGGGARLLRALAGRTPVPRWWRIARYPFKENKRIGVFFYFRVVVCDGGGV